jgi:hypothetical protein
MRLCSRLAAVLGLILAASVVVVLSPQPGEAQAQVVKDKFDFPYENTFYAADVGCLTEDVHVYGVLPMLFRTVTDGKGNLHFQFHDHADLTAEGMSTGDTYHTQGPAVVVEYYFKSDPSTPSRQIYHDLIHLVGPGRDGYISFRTLLHVVFNANGVQTVDISRSEILCH